MNATPQIVPKFKVGDVVEKKAYDVLIYYGTVIGIVTSLSGELVYVIEAPGGVILNAFHHATGLNLRR